MAEPSRYTPEQLSILLRIAAGKLGRDPVKLQEELQNGRLDGLLQSLGADREKVNALLSDREGLSQLLQSPQVRTLLQQLTACGPVQSGTILRQVLPELRAGDAVVFEMLGADGSSCALAGCTPCAEYLLHTDGTIERV